MSNMTEQRDDYIDRAVPWPLKVRMREVLSKAYTAGYLAGVHSQVLKQAEQLVAGKPNGFEQIAHTVHTSSV